jgi:Phospholipase_D-nuclease N-terminal
MKLRQFLDVVPRPVRVWAVVIVCCAVVGGFVAGYFGATAWKSMAANGSFALLVGILAAIWLLCLGFVFADARRRDMPAVAWMLMAMMVPNLLGFLLYFVLRKPLTDPCPSCGRVMSPEQPFCSWCGSSRSLAPVPPHEGLAAK